jgi:hypothetical protein
MKRMRRSIVVLLMAGALSLGLTGLAAAQTTVGDGLRRTASLGASSPQPPPSAAMRSKASPVSSRQNWARLRGYHYKAQ